MGLKTTNYEVKELGITLPEAYAQIVELSVSSKSVATARFSISKSRADIPVLMPVNVELVTAIIDKDKPIYEQMYLAAKETIFANWQDDIVE